MKTLPDSAIRYWSSLLDSKTFDSKREARQEIVRICERHARESWKTPMGAVTLPQSHDFAEAMPLYRDGDGWKVGRSLDEYLTMTPDFSDGTNGGPTGYPPSGGGAGSQVGLPDYKSVDRMKTRHEKLKNLLQRRDPTGTSKNAVDRSIRNFLKSRTAPGAVGNRSLT